MAKLSESSVSWTVCSQQLGLLTKQQDDFCNDYSCNCMTTNLNTLPQICSPEQVRKRNQFCGILGGFFIFLHPWMFQYLFSEMTRKTRRMHTSFMAGCQIFLASEIFCATTASPACGAKNRAPDYKFKPYALEFWNPFYGLHYSQSMK